MPSGLRRFQESGQSHFVTFSCDRRQPYFATPELFDLLALRLEGMRRRFAMYVYGYVVMPEHVHLLLSEPPRATLAEAIHFLKLSFSKRAGARLEKPGTFWQKRYYDGNVRDHREFAIKLRYMHRNPVRRGLVMRPEEWKWSSYRHYALRESGPVEVESQWMASDREAQDGQTKRIFLRPG
jgi:putative transposase